MQWAGTQNDVHVVGQWPTTSSGQQEQLLVEARSIFRFLAATACPSAVIALRAGPRTSTSTTGEHKIETVIADSRTGASCMIAGVRRALAACKGCWMLGKDMQDKFRRQSTEEVYLPREIPPF